MRAFRNVVFLVLALFLLGVNVQLFLNIVHPAGIYLIALDVIVSLIIVIDVIYGFELSARLNS